MTNERELQEFMMNIMNIKDLTMGGAWTGIAGGVTPQSSLVVQLRQSALAFNNAYSNEGGRQSLERLADQISGNLQSLQLFNVIDNERYAQLLKQLLNLMHRIDDAKS